MRPSYKFCEEEGGGEGATFTSEHEARALVWEAHLAIVGSTALGPTVLPASFSGLSG